MVLLARGPEAVWRRALLLLGWLLLQARAFMKLGSPSPAGGPYVIHRAYERPLSLTGGSMVVRQASLTSGPWKREELNRQAKPAGLPVQIRRATEKDFPAIAASRQLVVILARNQGLEADSNGILPTVTGMKRRDMLARIPGLMSGESVAFIGVGRGRDGKESVVASVDVSIKDADRFLPRRLFLKNMWVSPDYRRQRLATRLLDAVEQYARQNKVQYVFLEVVAGNEAAMRLYERYGFRYEDRGLQPVMKAIGMGRLNMYKWVVIKGGR